MKTIHPEMMEAMQDELAGIEKELTAELLWDRDARGDNTQNLLIEQFLQAGKIVLYGGELPTKFSNEVCDAARYFGYKVLSEVGDEQRKLLATISQDAKSPADHEFAMNNACHCVDMLMSLVYADACLAAHIKAAEMVEDDTEMLERARKDTQDIGENYRREMATPEGMKMLKLLRDDCNYIQNFKAMLPAVVEVPWFLNV